jgi:hypothetical protein
MSATKNSPSKINVQYAAAIQAIAAKDLQIAELVEENKRLQLLVNSIHFGSKSERRRSEEKDDGRQASLFGAVALPAAAAPEQVEEKIDVRLTHAARESAILTRTAIPVTFQSI